MEINQTVTRVDEISQNLLDVFLEPYKENCKYLKKAQFQEPDPSHLVGAKSQHQGLWLIKGEFSIPESCYIADTGHFNSVEFNICYNQLFYVAIAYLLENQLLEVMRDWDLATYKRRQLGNFLIVKFSSTFRKPINSNHFQGTLSIHKCSTRGQLIMLKTSCTFSDDNDDWAEGDVTITILNNETEQTHDDSQKSVSL